MQVPNRPLVDAILTLGRGDEEQDDMPIRIRPFTPTSGEIFSGTRRLGTMEAVTADRANATLRVPPGGPTYPVLVTYDLSYLPTRGGRRKTRRRPLYRR
jgi:hypothetical protein